MRKNRLRELFAADRAAFAGWMSFDSAYAAEVVASVGFDAVVIDGQHGMAGFETTVAMLQALSHTAAVPLVRVSHNSLAEINRVLDAGAYGVICPLVNSAAEAAAFARACCYPLDGVDGDRSMGPARGLLYGGADYPTHANAEILSLAMIETRAGLDALDTIVATPQLDGLFVGPTDLGIALGLGVGASHDEPLLAAALKRIADVCRAHGRVAGIWCASAEMGRAMVELGYRLVVPGHDAMCLKAELARRLAVLRT
ncbi:MAG: 2,4-dihydroxyhept-2-ene-1,7-dioic acid aldolase [Chitinophagaceae bacterium]|nr:2,4-dihydroxyhept-2-ene-1,7-dioic acid aldolase [Rubrivivax sp.]